MSTNVVDTSALAGRPLVMPVGNNGYGKYELLLANVPNTAATGVGALTITGNGSGFTSPPTISFTGGGGTGAAATAVLGFPFGGGTVTNAGQYTTNPTFAVVGGGGSGGTITANMKLVTASFAAQGTGYSIGDVLTLVGTYNTAPQLTVASVNGGGGVTSATISLAGNFGATPASPVAVTGGGGTGATFTIQSGVLNISANTGGQDYDSTTTISITGGAGPGGATATVILVSTGRVRNAVITNTGDAYGSAPTVVFTGGGGTGAAATAVVGGVNVPETLSLVFNPYLPVSNYSVDAVSSQACVVSYSAKTVSGCNIKLTPLNGSTLIAGTVDVIISYTN